ncbi:helix-turn-helix domain-containing protein [Advenella alkanexedens]|uniref:Helix-turn-helix domain-containing protein n=1 Tax=Advenella alkanexedens TaxID=1481665 RepID=A0ABS6NPY8_9BURK|nr:helix-turn-helix domain-containing protein [Advenella alkanexedens]MBV4397693.1 helix-turn-helix domain-containing protein [Advenella alkanexedens]
MNDKEMKQFEDELLQSVREMKNRQFARATKVNVTEMAKTRINAGFSQDSFAKLMGVSVRTLQEWEQGRRNPSGAAQTLLKIAGRHPEVLRELNEVV